MVAGTRRSIGDRRRHRSDQIEHANAGGYQSRIHLRQGAPDLNGRSRKQGMTVHGVRRAGSRRGWRVRRRDRRQRFPLQHRHVVPRARELHAREQSRNAAAHDDDAAHSPMLSVRAVTVISSCGTRAQTDVHGMTATAQPESIQSRVNRPVTVCRRLSAEAFPGGNVPAEMENRCPGGCSRPPQPGDSREGQAASPRGADGQTGDPGWERDRARVTQRGRGGRAEDPP